MPTNTVVSIAKGSFDEEALGSPQLTMDSIGSDSDGEAAGSNGAPSDKDEHDVRRQPRELGSPLSMSSDSVPSVHSTDQILDMKNRLDLSDSKAILMRLNNVNASAEPISGLSNRRSPSKLSNKSIPQLSTRPSPVHETHDSAVLRQAEFLYYLYSFAILGTTLRVFLGRLFGSDCESPGQIDDFMSPLSEQICVTSGGTTLQHGGALFVDLPANMLGSFVMGLVSSLYPEGGRYGSKLPWLRKTHPLQNHQGIHHAIKVGLCGSLTTFASWNSQMVTMIDGTYTELGPQVVPAIFGYMIGMACAVYAFSMGGKVHEWLYDWSNRRYQDVDDNDEKPPSDPSMNSIDHDEEQPTSWDSEESSPRSHKSTSGQDKSTQAKEDATRGKLTIKDRAPSTTNHAMSTCFHKVIPFCISVSIIVAYGLGADEGNMQFFRNLFASSLLTPVGVHLRWKLSALNGRGIRCGSSRKYEWMPWGTFTCNVIAVVISVVFQALMMQYTRNGKGDSPYVLALLVGMKTGVAGSLSTVSSFAKETVNLATSYPTHAKSCIYSTGTIMVSMLLGLAIYSPMVRNS